MVTNSRIRTRSGWTLRRTGVAVFFASVAVNAVLGVVALLVPTNGWILGRALGTSIAVTVGILGVLACLSAFTRRVAWPLAPVAMLSVATAFVVLLTVIWGSDVGDTHFEMLWSSVVIALTLVLLSLVLGTRVADRFRSVPSSPHAWRSLPAC